MVISCAARECDGIMLTGKRLGNFLRNARRKAGLTLRDVEALSAQLAPNQFLKVNYAYLSKLERGAYVRPSAEKLIVLAVIYGLDHRELLEKVGLAGGTRGPADVAHAVSSALASSMKSLPAALTEFLEAALPVRLGGSARERGALKPAFGGLWKLVHDAKTTGDRLGKIIRQSLAIYWEGDQEKMALLEAFLDRVTTPESLEEADARVEEMRQNLERIKQRQKRRGGKTKRKGRRG